MNTEKPVTENREEEPWPIANAMACLKETRDDAERHAAALADTDSVEWQLQNHTVLAMDYAIEVVKAINQLREPQPPDPAREAQRAIREFCRELGRAFEGLGQAFEDIASGYIPEGYSSEWGDSRDE